jgi:fructose-1,6-bisphosphatase/inositol monophosphatase family enzyme
VDTDGILALLQEVAEEVINPRFRALRDHQVAEKNPGDLVTVADREAEVLITRRLLDAYPGAAVLGEEAFAADPEVLVSYAAAPHAFTVDPIDGTKNFVNGSEDHGVMVAELKGPDVVRSWIWQPQHQVAYVAERGAGAFRDGVRLTRPPLADPASPRGVTSYRRWVGRSLGQLPPMELTWICCAVDYPMLVQGAADYIVYRGRQPWDHAPGSLLLRESGAHLGTFGGDPYDARTVPPGGLIGAASAELYAELLPLIPDH